jgi:hypothetical protein
MELKNFAKKAVVAGLVGAFAIGALAACSSSDKSSTASMSKTDSDSQTARGKNSTYQTK